MALWPRDIPPLPLPFQSMKVNEENITHDPTGYTPSGWPGRPLQDATGRKVRV